jgi:hypothetical protein
MNDSRAFLRAGSAIAVLFALLPAPAFAAGAAPDISGIYQVTRYDAKLVTTNGAAPPLNDAGRAEYAKNQAGLRDGSVTDYARKFCVPDGIPRVMSSPYPFEIVQGPPGQITLVHELNHQLRIVAMDKPLPSDMELIPYPFYNGHSAGRFEGDTLVIDSAGFNEKTFLDATGLPHSDQLKTQERIRKIGNNQLEDVVTITDPAFYTASFSARFVYDQKNLRLEDYVCGETHRDISALPGVRRP